MIERAIADLPFLTFDALDRHPEITCFVSTRAGGRSAAPYDTLNLGLGVGDDARAVRHNRERLCRITGGHTADLAFAAQVHGTRVTVVERAAGGRAAKGTDALVTDRPDTPLVILVADCAAVVLYDPGRRAIGVAHAGWRGTLAGIAPRTLEVMQRRFGTDPAQVVAAIAPSIGPCCYQVGPEVADAYRAAHPRLAPLVLSAPPARPLGDAPGDSRGRVMLDLPEANARLLQDAGVGPSRVQRSGLCTACETGRFYSHRSQKGRTGRFATVAMLHGRTRRAY